MLRLAFPAVVWGHWVTLCWRYNLRMWTLCPCLLSGTLQQKYWYEIILILGRCWWLYRAFKNGGNIPVFCRISSMLSESPSQSSSSSQFWRENKFRASWRRMCFILKSLWLVYLTWCLSITRQLTHSPVSSGKTVMNARRAASLRFKVANVHAAFPVLSSFCGLTWSTFASSCPGKTMSNSSCDVMN